MPSSKKAILSTAIVLFFVIAISAVITLPYLRSESEYYLDSEIREELAGNIDCIILGSSHTLTAFDTATIDDRLDCFSYNISGLQMTLDGRYYMLEKELARNPVDTVILELSYNAFTRIENEEYAHGDESTIARLDSFSERIGYLLRYVTLDDWLNLYSRQISSGLSHYASMVLGSLKNAQFVGEKGSCFYDPVDVSIAPEKVAEEYNSGSVNQFREENTEKVVKILRLCEDKGIKVIVVVTPVSDSFLWRLGNMDYFRTSLEDFCETRQLELYDFNLINSRYSLFQDDVSYKDQNHLSKPGAEAFTDLMCDILERVAAGEDVSDEFYDSYASLLKDSPYRQYLNN